MRAAKAAGGRTLIFRNLQKAPGEVLIAGIESGVTVEKCVFQGESVVPFLVFEDVGGPIRIEACQFAGRGVGISDARESVVLLRNRFDLGSSPFPGIGVDAASATLEDNTAAGDGFAGLALDVEGEVVVDLNEAGGLLNDPTLAGASPDQVFSAIDFDNDDQHCADSPPPQYREDAGGCVRAGVPPPR